MVDAAVKTEMHIKRKERQKDVKVGRNCTQQKKKDNPSGGHLGKMIEKEEFETWLFEDAILHHGWGTSKRLNLTVAKIMGLSFTWYRDFTVIMMSLAPISQ